MTSPHTVAGRTRGATRPWVVLAVVCVAQLMIVLDATVVNLALPSAQRDLGFDDSSRQWVVSGYALAFGSLLLLGGRVAGLIGYRRAFLIGVVGFAVASALGGAAGSLEVLVLARALQGVFAALLAPATLSLLTVSFPDGRERARAFGVFGAIAAAGGGVGLLLGGVLTQQLSWRWCLYINLVFAVVAVIGALLALPTTTGGRDRQRIDVPGAVLVTTGLFSLVYGFSSAEARGWVSPVTWVPLLLGVLLLAGFVLVQHRGSHPLMPLRLLADRDRVGAYVALLSAAAAMFGVFLFLSYYLQEILGYGPVLNGLAFLPLILVSTLCSTMLNGPLVARFGHRSVIAGGLVKAAGGLLLFLPLDATSQFFPDVLPGLVLFGLGIGLAMAPAIDLGTAHTSGSDAGAAAALVTTLQQVGGSLGIAVLSTISAAVAGAGTPGVGSTVAGYSATYLWAAVIVGVGGVVTAVLLRSRKQAAEHAAARTAATDTAAAPVAAG